ncbi:MAG: hypothetical protein MJY79_06315 [Bacteroidaceae bacterium]|nr:hypothetical protein [Bacteroidaceae bacterium]
MKKLPKTIFKTVGITLASLLSVIILILGIACFLLFTRSGLEKTAAFALKKYSPCHVTLGDSKLTFFKTFPHLGLEIDDIVVYNELETAPTDTLASIGSLVGTVDFMELVRNRNIVIERIRISDIQANVFTDSLGNSTLDLFSDSTDTAEKEPFVLPDSINTGISFDLKEISLKRLGASYIDCQSGISAGVLGANASLKGAVDSLLVGNLKLSLDVDSVCASMKDSVSSTDAIIRNIALGADCGLAVPTIDIDGKLTVDKLGATMGQTNAFVNNFSLKIDGSTDIRNLLVDAAVNLAMGKIGMESDSLTAGINGISLKLDALTGSDSVLTKANLRGTTGPITLAMPYDTLALTTEKIGIDAVTNAYLAKMDGNANIGITTRNMSFSMGGTPLIVNTDTLSLRADAAKDSSIIKCTPILYSRSLEVVMDTVSYISGWPVKASLPLVTDTCFNHFILRDGKLEADAIGIGADADIRLTDSGFSGQADISTDQMSIEDLLAMIPEQYQSMLEGIAAKGLIKLGISGRASMSDGNLDVSRLSADVELEDVEAGYCDTISAKASSLALNMTYPGAMNAPDYQTMNISLKSPDLKADMTGSTPINARLTDVNLDGLVANILEGIDKTEMLVVLRTGNTKASMDTIKANVDNMALGAYFGYTTIQDKQMELNASIDFDALNASIGSMMNINIGPTSVSATSVIDTLQENMLLRYEPNLNFYMTDTRLDGLAVPVSMPVLDFDFNLVKFNIKNSRIQLGQSDISLTGDLYNIKEFLNGTGLMTGQMDFLSDHADMDELLALASGFGGGENSEEPEQEDLAESFALVEDSIPANPFIVPKGVDFVLNTNLKEMEMNDHLFTNVGGEVSIRNGILILRELGFHSSTGQMQLTAIYKTPEPDDLYVGLDFHLLDIEVDELIDLIPSVDSIVPMLKSFTGLAQFHLAGESNLDGYYMPKMPTLIGAAGIEGQNLVVMDNEVFKGLRRKLLMSRKAEPVIDHLDVEMQVLRNKVDLYPFVVQMDRYKAALGGRHNINKDLDCRYHISLLQTPLPIRFGVTVQGSLEDIAAHPLRRIKLSKCEYGKDYRQTKTGTVEEHVAYMKEVIAKTLRENVRQTD